MILKEVKANIVFTEEGNIQGAVLGILHKLYKFLQPP